jgi:HK97 gp10 family phage protein
MADIEIKGLSDLLKNLRELPKTVQQKCLRQAMVPGAQLIRESAKDIHRSKVSFWASGLIEKAIRIAFNKKESTPGKAIYHVFVSSNVRAVGAEISGSRATTKKLRAAGEKGKMRTPFYWRFLEFGTIKMAARPFMRPAFDVSSNQAISLITNKLAELIEKEAEHIGKS